MAAPEISAFGDDAHSDGETGLVIDGGGFGAFPGEVWMFANANRTGSADQLTVGAWNDIQLTGVAIPGSTNNVTGTVYLLLQREDLAWSQGHAFTLASGAAPATVLFHESTTLFHNSTTLLHNATYFQHNDETLLHKS